jgi:hypothetical protein
LTPALSKAVFSIDEIHTFKSSRLCGLNLTYGLKFLGEKWTLTKDIYMSAEKGTF